MHAARAELTRPACWVCWGLEAIEESVRALDLGHVDFMDVDGNLL